MSWESVRRLWYVLLLAALGDPSLSPYISFYLNCDLPILPLPLLPHHDYHNHLIPRVDTNRGWLLEHSQETIVPLVRWLHAHPSHELSVLVWIVLVNWTMDFEPAQRWLLLLRRPQEAANDHQEPPLLSIMAEYLAYSAHAADAIAHIVTLLDCLMEQGAYECVRVCPWFAHQVDLAATQVAQYKLVEIIASNLNTFEGEGIDFLMQCVAHGICVIVSYLRLPYSCHHTTHASPAVMNDSLRQRLLHGIGIESMYLLHQRTCYPTNVQQ